MNGRSTVSRPTPELDGKHSLATEAYLRIEEEIVLLRLEPGKFISEDVLSDRLKIGRTPVREALQRLAQAKLVVIIPRRGIYVSEISVSSQLKLLELRREVERLLARCAALRAADSERHEFADFSNDFARIARDRDVLGFLRLDSRFYPAMARSARNEYAAAPLSVWHSHSRRFWYHHSLQSNTADVRRAAALKVPLARAIAEGKDLEAARAVEALLDYIEGYTRAAWELETRT
jgi:DNA-binding GntR family transcriptional regulator